MHADWKLGGGQRVGAVARLTRLWLAIRLAAVVEAAERAVWSVGSGDLEMSSRKRGKVGAVLRQSRYGMAVVGIFSFFLNILVLVSPIYSMQLFDRVLPSRSQQTLVFLTLFSVFAITVLALLDALRVQALNRIARWWDETVRKDVFTASILTSLRSGTPVMHGLQDLHTLRTFIASSGPLPLFDAPWVPFFLLVLFLLHPWLGLLSLTTAIILLGLAVLNDVITRRALAGVSEAQMKLTSSASLALRNADTIQAMGMHDALEGRLLEQNSAIQRSIATSADRGAWVAAVSKFVRISVQIGIMGLGAWLTLGNQLTAGGMIAASIILGRALAPIEQSIGLWRNFISARESYNRITALIAVADDEEEVMSLSPPAGRISVEQLSYAVPNTNKLIVKGIQFELEPGTALAIIGPSAAGKSTLCRLLAGSLRPSSGHVRLDGADLYRWSRADVGRHVGYLPQSVELFAASVKDNICRLGVPDDAAVEIAAVFAGCNEMIRRLPNGYETNIGDAGAYLSGGQRQRIGLARAVYGSPRLIVLDEPDSNLDDEGVSALVNAIGTLRSQGTSIIVVTHRPALVRACNKMMLIANGKLEAFGDTVDVQKELRTRQDQLRRSRAAGELGADVGIAPPRQMPQAAKE